jgi:hypothetical protein
MDKRKKEGRKEGRKELISHSFLMTFPSSFHFLQLGRSDGSGVPKVFSC